MDSDLDSTPVTGKRSPDAPGKPPDFCLN